MKHIITPSGDVVLTLTQAETHALYALVLEGKEYDMVRAYIANTAAAVSAARAAGAVQDAALDARKFRKGGSNG